MFGKMKDRSVDNAAAASEKPQDPASTETASAPATPNLEELQKKAAKADENWERVVRISADLDNYKKRAAREKQDAIRYANESLLEKLIPVLDNLEMALLAAKSASESTSAQSLLDGVAMIQQQLKTVLGECGLEEVDATRQVFDPNVHEAVSQMPSAEVAEGHVLQQLRRGYKLKDRLLRPATVVVASKP